MGMSNTQSGFARHAVPCNRFSAAIRVSQLLTLSQAGTSAYLAHLFASSLMSRWLLHYSPFAVLLRLCSLSILLSYGCREIFRLSGTTRVDLKSLSQSLPIWVVIAIGLLLTYFFTQQDISVEQDRDDRRRRLVLRLKCLYAIAFSSLFSLLVIVCLVHFSMASWDAAALQVSMQRLLDGLQEWRAVSFLSRGKEL